MPDFSPKTLFVGQYVRQSDCLKTMKWTMKWTCIQALLAIWLQRPTSLVYIYIITFVFSVVVMFNQHLHSEISVKIGVWGISKRSWLSYLFVLRRVLDMILILYYDDLKLLSHSHKWSTSLQCIRPRKFCLGHDYHSGVFRYLTFYVVRPQCIFRKCSVWLYMSADIG